SAFRRDNRFPGGTCAQARAVTGPYCRPVGGIRPRLARVADAGRKTLVPRHGAPGPLLRRDALRGRAGAAETLAEGDARLCRRVRRGPGGVVAPLAQRQRSTGGTRRAGAWPTRRRGPEPEPE